MQQNLLNTLLVLERYFPEFPGGTEIYVRELCRELLENNYRPLVIIPCESCQEEARYNWEGVDVLRVFVAGEGGSTCALKEMLVERGIQLIHYHSWNRGLPLAVARAAANLDIAQVMTLHHPTMVCPIGTGIKFDIRPCLGAKSFVECAACMLHRKRFPVVWAKVLAPLRLASAQFTFRRESARMWRQFSAFITHSDWIKGFLAIYGVSGDKFFDVPQVRYMSLQKKSNVEIDAARAAGKVVFGFLGRCKKIKGADLLVRAISLLPPHYNIRAEIHFSGEPCEEYLYFRKVKELASEEPRVAILPAIRPDEVITKISHWDAMVIPSRFMETGPFTLFEAAQAGVPVIGSDSGGITEKIIHGKNGLLFAFDDPVSLAQQLRRVADDRELLTSLKMNASLILDTKTDYCNVDVYRKALCRK